MENRNLVSVIVPIYNVEKYLSKCIDSIINQTYENIEILLVDDGSPDNCGKICDEYSKKDSRIKVIHKKNGGLSDARNCGIDNSTGKYLFFLDSDDYIKNDTIEYLINLIIRDKSDIAISKIQVVYKNIIEENASSKSEVLDSLTVLNRMLYSDSYYISSCGKLFNKNLFKEIRFPVGKNYEDVGTIYKLYALASKISCGYNQKYYYIIRSDSITNKKFSNKEYDLIEMTDGMCNFILKNYPQLEAGAHYRKVFSRISLICKKNYPYKKNDENIKIIKDNYKEILKNSMVPKKSKLAIILLMINEKLFFKTWHLYCKMTSRKI